MHIYVDKSDEFRRKEMPKVLLLLPQILAPMSVHVCMIAGWKNRLRFMVLTQICLCIALSEDGTKSAAAHS